MSRGEAGNEMTWRAFGWFWRAVRAIARLASAKAAPAPPEEHPPPREPARRGKGRPRMTRAQRRGRRHRA